LVLAVTGAMTGTLGGALVPATAQAPADTQGSTASETTPGTTAGTTAEAGTTEATQPPATSSSPPTDTGTTGSTPTDTTPPTTSTPARTDTGGDTKTKSNKPAKKDKAKPKDKAKRRAKAKDKRKHRRHSGTDADKTREVPPACEKLQDWRDKDLEGRAGEHKEAAIRKALAKRCEVQRERQSERIKKQRAESRDAGDAGDGTSDAPAPQRTAGGAPTVANPTTSVSTPGAAVEGVPNFFIEKFRIPPFLLPIYQAAGIQYNIPWQVLAAINEIESDYGRNLNVSSAGALGWMQFIPSSWKTYGVDANEDGRKDPYNPVDAIFAAARYLKAADGEKDIRRAIFAYNHADWYVDSVMLRAKLIGGLPSEFVGSLTGLTEGRFPVHAASRYADDLSEAEARKRVRRGENAANPVEGQTSRRSIKIYSRKGAPVIAANDGVIRRVGVSGALGRYVELRDVYGNTFTYAHLGSTVRTYPARKPRPVSRRAIAKELDLPSDPKPEGPASATATRRRGSAKVGARGRAARKATTREVSGPPTPAAPAARASDPKAGTAAAGKQRLFANPTRPNARDAGGALQVTPKGELYNPYSSGTLKLDPSEMVLKRLKPGAKVIAGTVLGRLGEATGAQAPHLEFAIRPAGRGAPKVDPKPILDGWKLLESTAIYRAKGKNALYGADADGLTVGQILLMPKEELAERVLADPRIDIYECGRRDIRAGEVDRRVLATMAFLASSGVRPTVSSLKCGHGFLTKSGNVSAHSSGNAVDVAAVNGVPIMGHQGEGSITELTIRRLLTLQGTMKPDQIISLMDFKEADNTLVLPDHDDHIHVGFQPLYGSDGLGSASAGALKPRQWAKLINRLGEIDNPTVRTRPSKDSIPAEE